MPFDDTTTRTTPSLALLRDVLRDGEGHPLWPSNFKFDYSNVRCCGIGLAQQLWPAAFGADLHLRTSERMARAFNIDPATARAIFILLPLFATRQMLVYAIDRHLRSTQ
jgi:hypothetical protein